MESAGSVPACVCAQVDMWTVTALGLCCFTCEFRPMCVWMFLYDAQAHVRGDMCVFGVTGTRLMRL